MSCSKCGNPMKPCEVNGKPSWVCLPCGSALMRYPVTVTGDDKDGGKYEPRGTDYSKPSDYCSMKDTVVTNCTATTTLDYPFHGPADGTNKETPYELSS